MALDRDDLQYACIFPVPSPRPCPNPENPDQGCDCIEQAEINGQNPLCQAPDGSYGNVQYFAKAYPATRHLDLLERLGDRGVVASVCARNVSNQSADDYGYRPATSALIDRLGPVIE